MSISINPQPDPGDLPRLYADAGDCWSEPVWRLSNLRATDGSEIVVGRHVCTSQGRIKVSDIVVYVRPAANPGVDGVGMELQHTPEGGPQSELKLAAQPYVNSTSNWVASASEEIVTCDPKAYLSVMMSIVGKNGAPDVTHHLLDPISRSELFQIAWVW